MRALCKRDYERFLRAGNDMLAGVTAEAEFLRLSQTAGGHHRLLKLVNDGATDAEVLVADLLFSFLIQENKPYVFEWKQIYGSGSIQGCEGEVWPIKEFDLMPYLLQSVSALYPPYGVARPDKAKKLWLDTFIQLCTDSSLLRPLVSLSSLEGADGTSFNALKSSKLMVEFPSGVRDQIAAPFVPSDLYVPASWYMFPVWSKNRIPGGFFANRSMLLRFKVEKKMKGGSMECMPLPKFLNMTGLPDFLSWREMVSAGHRSVPQWFKSIINAPFNKGGMFSVELDFDSLSLKITKLFDITNKSEEEDSTDESGK